MSAVEKKTYFKFNKYVTTAKSHGNGNPLKTARFASGGSAQSFIYIQLSSWLTFVVYSSACCILLNFVIAWPNSATIFRLNLWDTPF